MLSRVAESLYWLSRYLERAANSARVLDVHLDLMLDHPIECPREAWRRVASSLSTSIPEELLEDPSAVLEHLAFDELDPDSILSCVGRARENAKHVREEISGAMWEHLNRLYLQLRTAKENPSWSTLPGDFFQAVAQSACLFMGITASTMSHSTGWNLIQAGRNLERATARSQLLQAYCSDLEPGGPGAEPLEGRDLRCAELLACARATEAYCKSREGHLRPAPIWEFLLLDEEFPGSVRFAVDRLEEALRAVGACGEGARSGDVVRTAGKLKARLSYAVIDEILAEGTVVFLESVRNSCETLHEEIHKAWISYALTDVLAC